MLVTRLDAAFKPTHELAIDLLGDLLQVGRRHITAREDRRDVAAMLVLADTVVRVRG
jgi:hypothetical protein